MSHFYDLDTEWKVDYGWSKDGKVEEDSMILSGCTLAGVVMDALTILDMKGHDLGWDEWTVWNAGIVQDKIL